VGLGLVRSLLGLSRLDRCQDLPGETWIARDELWHVVFVSYRWDGVGWITRIRVGAIRTWEPGDHSPGSLK
jgi:hypothetical protein